MPEPAYIILADKRLEDKATGRLSVIDIFEKVSVVAQHSMSTADTPNASKSDLQGFALTAISVWVINDKDKGMVFENTILFQDSAGKEHFELHVTPITIAPDEQGVFHRIFINFNGLPPIPSSGIWRFVNKIRRLGGDDESWISQSIPFVFTADDKFLTLVSQSGVKPEVRQPALPETSSPNT